MASFNSQFETELRAIIEDERAETLSNMENRGAIPDYSAYCEQVGYLKALRAVEDWCAQVQTKLEQR